MITFLHVCVIFLLPSWKQVFACSKNGPCRKLVFPNFLFFADKRLLNHSITTLQVRDLDECELRCYHEPNCVSINFLYQTQTSGKYICELNNSTHGEHDGDLLQAENYFYRGTKVRKIDRVLNFCKTRKPYGNLFLLQLNCLIWPNILFQNACSNFPCKNNGTCQSGFTKKGYQCLCPSGWTGGLCQVDINECDEKSDACNKNALCKNTRGSYRCSCKTGFYGDGYNCTDIDECQEQKHKCGNNANCTNTDGSYTCTCDVGLYADGYNCTECETIFDFEDHDLSNWTLEGTAFNNQPTYGPNPSKREGEYPTYHKGDWWIGTFENRPSPSRPIGGKQGDKPKGSMTSSMFVITGKSLKFLIGAGCDYKCQKECPDVRAELIVEGNVIDTEKPKACTEAMSEKSWNVSGYVGKHAQLRLVDNSSVGWGHINFDHLQVCHRIKKIDYES